MSQFNDTNSASVTLTGTVSQYERVLATGTQAGLTGQDIGVAKQNGVSGETIAVSLVNKQGTQKMIAAGAISAGAKVHTAASGRVSATATVTSYCRGIAMSAATAAGDVIEVLPIFSDKAN